MTGYLNSFVGYVLNFFKKENRTNVRDVTACSTPPRRCTSVIEDPRVKEDLVKVSAKQKCPWSSSAGKVNQQMSCLVLDARCPNTVRDLATQGKVLIQNEADENGRGDGLKPPRECCIYHDAAIGFSKEFPYFVPPTARKLHLPEQPPFGLRRSASLESSWPTEDRKRLTSRQKLLMRQNLNPTDNAFGMGPSGDAGKDYSPFKELIDWTPGRHSESSYSSHSHMLAEDHRPKSSKIPVYRKKRRPAEVSKPLPKLERAAVRGEPECTCYREILSGPAQRGWRVEGHAIYCPKSVVAYKSYLNTKLENLFRALSKKKYCGNIIDAASHAKWMRLAGVGVDENAACFRKYAKGRVALPVGQYKWALEKLCSDHNLDYWDLVRKMTDIEIGSAADSNSTLERKQVVNKRNA